MPHQSITTELCAIIEQSVFTDCNALQSFFYDRQEPGVNIHIPVNQSAINRFAELLSTPGLDINVSTSKNNSLIGHVLMLVSAMQMRYYGSLELSFENTAHLLDALSTHPSARQIVNHGRVYFTNSATGHSAPILSMMLVHCEEADGCEAWQPLIGLVVLNPTITPETTWEVMNAADQETALAIVQNSTIDPSSVNKAGETFLCASVVIGHCDVVEAMLDLPNCMPNRLSRERLMRFDSMGDPIAKVVLHPVLHAAVTLREVQWRCESTHLTEPMVRVLLDHKETDISQIRPHANYNRAVTAESMKQMLAHDSFDIHNIIVKGGPVLEDGDRFVVHFDDADFDSSDADSEMEVDDDEGEDVEV